MPAHRRAPRESDKFKPETQAELDAAVEKVARDRGARIIKARPGARLKATPEVIKKVLDAVEKGLPVDKAIMFSGVTEQALDRWKKANDSLLHLFRVAELKVEIELIGFVRNACPKDWKAANWLLERRFQWEQRTRAEVTGKDGAPLTVSHQLFASLAGAGDTLVKRRRVDRPVINVTPTPASK